MLMPKSRRDNNASKKFNAFSNNLERQSFTPRRLNYSSDSHTDLDYFLDSDDPLDDSKSKTHVIKKSSTISTWTKAISGEGICYAMKQFFKNIPHNIWTFFIQALLIPHYRPEWGKYIKWDHELRPTITEQRIREKRRNAFRSRTGSKSSRLIRQTTRKFLTKKRHYSKKKYATDRPPEPVKHDDHCKCAQIRINVSGQIFEPQLRTLERFPDTLLGDPRRMVQFYDPERDEFFFDRHRSSFEAILYYYNTGGLLRRPTTVSQEIFLDEVKFYDLGPKVLSNLQNRNVGRREDYAPLPKDLFKRKLWLLFEYPESSYQSRIFAYISILAVCTSIFEFCIETLPYFDMDEAEEEEPSTLNMRDPFFFTETLCIIFFVVEYVMRAATCPHFFRFVKEISNLIDLVAIMPYFLNLLYNINDRISGHKSSKKELQSRAVSLTVFRVIRLVRVFRILKLSRHNRGLKILGKTLRASSRELGLLMFFLMVGVVVFSSAIFFAESQYTNSPFTSIPDGFWFGVVTMTTLGYGDMVPVGPLGKIIGALCAIAGVLTISLPVPVIVSNFNMFYNSEEMNNPQTAASKTLPECDHVEHCPYYPAWYTRDGQVIDGKMHSPKVTAVNSAESYCVRWLMGEQQPDFSDSDFEELLDEDFLKHKFAHLATKKSRISHKKPKVSKQIHWKESKPKSTVRSINQKK